MTTTRAELPVPYIVFAHLLKAFRDAGYDHAIGFTPEGKSIDMDGITVTCKWPTRWPAKLDADGQPKLQANHIEIEMVDVLNSTKAFLDDDIFPTASPFPPELRARIDAALTAFEARRFV